MPEKAALLLEPHLRPDGPWAHYTPLLPTRPPSATHWHPSQLQRLQGASVPQSVAELREALHESHAVAAPALCSLATPSSAEAFSLERWMWAYAIVETRGLVLELSPGEKTTCLVPVADMLNHTATAALAWPRLESAAAQVESKAAGGELVFRTLRPVSAAAEVHLYYGRLPCLQALQHYGFVDEASLAREDVQIDLELPDEEVAMSMPEEAAGEEAADLEARMMSMAQEAAAEQRSRRMSLLSDRGLTLGPHFLRDGAPLPPRLLETLKVICMSADELQAEGDGGSWSADLHGRVCATLQSLLESLAESLLPAPPGPEEGTEQDTEQERDAGVDAAIDMYLAFQRRVLQSALVAAYKLEGDADHGPE